MFLFSLDKCVCQRKKLWLREFNSTSPHTSVRGQPGEPVNRAAGFLQALVGGCGGMGVWGVCLIALTLPFMAWWVIDVALLVLKVLKKLIHWRFGSQLVFRAWLEDADHWKHILEGYILIPTPSLFPCCLAAMSEKLGLLVVSDMMFWLTMYPES